MKKLSKVFMIVALAGLLSGCFGKKSTEEQANTQQKQQQSQGQQSNATQEPKKNLFDFLTLGTGTKCEIEDKTGKYTMYSKGDKVKAEGISYGVRPDPATGEQKEQKGTMINDGAWVYIWSEKEGIKMNIKEMEEMGKQYNKEQPGIQKNSLNWKDWIRQMESEEGVKYECSPTALTDTDFIPPADVKFQDMAEIMKGFIQMGEQMKRDFSNPAPKPDNSNSAPMPQ